MVNSIVGVRMVFTRKEKQQNKSLFSQLSERDTGFMTGQNNQEEQIESRDYILCRGTSSDIASNPTQIKYPRVDVHTLEENMVSKVRRDMDNVLTSFETCVQDALLTAIENLVILRVELAMKSTNAPSGWCVDRNVLESDQRDFLGNIEGLRMTASSRIKSHWDLNRIDEPRGNVIVEEGDLFVNRKTTDRQSYAHRIPPHTKANSSLID